MAVHTFSVNMDSLSGSMAHNYYLYEYDGQLNIIPWDYNLSFGGMSMGSTGGATGMINDAIDTPFSGTKFFDALLQNEEYLERYHEYLRRLVEEYVEGGRFEEVYNRIRSQIDSLVETDPTAFYSGEEYQTAVEMLHETILLRAESIKGQLNGTIPSTDSGQSKDSSTLVDGSGIDVKVMGQFNMGGFSGDNAVKAGRRAGGRSSAKTDGNSEGQNDGSRPAGFDFGDIDFSDMDFSSMFGGFGGQRPSGSMPGRQSTGSTAAKNLVTFGICLAVMLIALFGTKLVKRRKYARS